MKPAAPFQRRTAEFAFRRLWTDPDPAYRFLIADEVGLGKTVVAREIVALTLDHLAGGKADVVYLCSNRTIASQNLEKLTGRWHTAPIISTRLTLLAFRNPGSRVRFIALTPGTSFTITRSQGQIEERALIWTLLQPWLHPPGLEDTLRIVTPVSWKRALDAVKKKDVDATISHEFRAAVERDADLLEEIRACAAGTAAAKDDRAFRSRRRTLIGRLRTELARAGARTLARRGLVILDEFQRFPELLQESGKSLAAALAQEVFGRRYKHRRVLLLSATPYRMPGTADLPGEKPHADLTALFRFLTGDPRREAELEHEIALYSRLLMAGASREAEILATRDRIQSILRTVMVRTERVGMTRACDAMVVNDPVPLPVTASDLEGGIAARRLARKLKSHDTTEYWKSAPYMLEFMRGYDLKRKALNLPEKERQRVEAQARRHGLIIAPDRVVKHEDLAVPNARLRDLIRRALPKGAERLLWIPPSLPYTVPGGPFSGAGNQLKTLVFSEWQLAPEAIAALTSYEVERRLVTAVNDLPAQGKRKKAPITFASYPTLGDRLRLEAGSEGETGSVRQDLAALALLYPSARLADLIDPLAMAVDKGRAVPPRLALARAKRVIGRALADLPAKSPASKRATGDKRWYWAAPILLDRKADVRTWLASVDCFSQGVEETPEAGKGAWDGDGIRQVILGLVDGSVTLGPPPHDLAEVLAEITLASPGICALRALRRALPAPSGDAVLRRAAFRLARGFQALFNQPEATLAVLLSHSSDQPADRPDVPYWRQALLYALAGNLQSVLDEQAHLEADGLSLHQVAPDDMLDRASRTLSAPMRLRSAGTAITGLKPRRSCFGKPKPDGAGAARMRGRHAMRFAEVKEEDGTVTRLDAIRAAFNSPFRPFVLASTSVGQEGLDFHPWCHVVHHWNLPRGPVELEQREGRVHRYKGHAVRLNIAKGLGLAKLRDMPQGAAGDPWENLFTLAEGWSEHELAPRWIFEACDEPVKVVRRVPMPAFSQETERLPRLLRRVALYRLVLGQPRQEDLLVALERRGITEEQARAWRIDLSPPAMPVDADGIAQDETIG
ncbi:helicase-related protein [Azospirillum sp. TSO35-2]|uniref:helicase-related protein n=1 Tax=Azospirillum sp. TSO35-2 TaxID=716796 RepID=UPI000D617829|nr:helicase-related protein [Azospirillum sp. TSO35-2]PWC39114.1 hypothetical protein TSO352_02475 [Azospirillum sp. TSO35-2]